MTMDKHSGAGKRAAAMVIMALICVLLWPSYKSGANELQAAVMMEVLEKTDVFEEPDTGAQVLGQLEKGDRTFAVELEEGGWYRVVFQGVSGYIKGDILKKYGSEQSDASENLYDTGGKDVSDNPEAAGPSGEIIYPEEEYKKLLAEAETSKNSPMKVTAGIFAAVVLFIAVDAAYTLVKGKKKAKTEEEGILSEDIQDSSEAEQEQADDGMEFLDLQ